MEPFLRSKLTIGVLGILVLWLVVLCVAAGIRQHTSSAELERMDARIGDAERENARLTDELKRMQEPQWLALLARQRLNYKNPGETVVFVYKNEKSGTIVQPQQPSEKRPNWKQWLDWLRGE